MDYPAIPRDGMIKEEFPRLLNFLTGPKKRWSATIPSPNTEWLRLMDMR
jgi:hypothetical protein